jgi:hypothetical protein
MVFRKHLFYLVGFAGFLPFRQLPLDRSPIGTVIIASSDVDITFKLMSPSGEKFELSAAEENKAATLCDKLCQQSHCQRVSVLSVIRLQYNLRYAFEAE